MLTGQIKPTSGSLRVHGVYVLEDPIRVRELVGVIPEQETPPSFLTAEEYLHFVAKDLLDLKRSEGGFGKLIFSFLLPAILIWMLLSALGTVLPALNTLILF